MSDLFRNDYYRLYTDGNIVRLERTSTPYPSIAEMHACHRDLAEAMGNVGVGRILLDLRSGPPGRNDETFEHETAVWRRRLRERGERVALLVKTVAGKLQAQRLSRSEGNTLDVFLDENEALAFLRG
jgi:hypothetical protein